MTESEWLTCTAPEAILGYLEGKVSDRKLRLFACACCARITHLLTDPQCRFASELATRFAEGAASVEQLVAAHTTAQNSKPLFADANWAAAWTACPNAAQAAAEASNHAAESVARLVAEPARSAAWAAVRTGASEEARALAWARFETLTETARMVEESWQASLLRELVGNPFHSLPAPEYWPESIVALAQALYAGEDCAFALQDALLEAGHTELAAHFEEPVQRHPKGCWALDLLLAKE
jgi:hypothetical protein